MFQASQQVKALAHVVMHVRVSGGLVTGDREGAHGRKSVQGGGCGQAGVPIPGVFENTGLSLLPLLCSGTKPSAAAQESSFIWQDGE